MFSGSIFLSSSRDYSGTPTISNLAYGSGGGGISSVAISSPSLAPTSGSYSLSSYMPSSASSPYNTRGPYGEGDYVPLDTPPRRFEGRLDGDIFSTLGISECGAAWLTIGVLGFLLLRKKKR